MIAIGTVREIVRYPVKSMAGVAAESALLTWHGLDGDRRFAFRRLADRGGFPWLSASRLPELLRYRPVGLDQTGGEPLPTHVVTPAGSRHALGSDELTAEVAARLDGGVEWMRLKHGVFDDGPVSLISLATVARIAGEAGVEPDRRRFRMNLVIETDRGEPFGEDEWVGRTLAFGEGEGGPMVSVTTRDPRCAMLNLDPETAAADPRVLKAVVRLNGNCAGVYATAVRTGTIRVGDQVSVSSRS